MDAKTSSSNKRGNNVVSRRGGQATSEDVRPLLAVTTTATTTATGNTKASSTKASSHLVAPPRSGQFILPTFASANSQTNDHSRDHHKRHYRVNLPTRMLSILAMVFLAIPLMIFFYKEVHIHDDHHHQAHFKPEKFVNVNTREVISQFSNHAQETKDQNDWEDDEEVDAALSKDEEIEEKVKVKIESSPDSQKSDKDKPLEPKNEEVEEADEDLTVTEKGSPAVGEEVDTPEVKGEDIDEGEEENNEITQENNTGGAADEKEEKKESAKGPNMVRRRRKKNVEGSRRTNRIRRRV